MEWHDVRTLFTGLLVVSVAMVSAPIVAVGGFLVYRVGGEYLSRTDFDASAWQKSALPADEPPTGAARLRMVDDLLDRHDLEGMTRSEVTALLGEPDDAENFILGWDMAYYLGPERGLLPLDSEWLAIRLNEVQQVGAYRIIVP